MQRAQLLKGKALTSLASGMAALLRMICKDARWLPDTSAEPAVAPVRASTAHNTGHTSHQPACSKNAYLGRGVVP